MFNLKLIVEKAQQHVEELRGHRDTVLLRIAGYHCILMDLLIKLREGLIIYKGRVRTQQELIRTRRGEAITLRQEADRFRAEADSCAILGTCERELGNRSSALLEQAEVKQREDMRREREADDLE